MVLACFVLCVALWQLAAGFWSSLVLFVVELLCLVNPVWHYNYPVGEEETGDFVFLFSLWHVVTI